MKARYISLEPLIRWMDVPRPLDLGALFGRDAPVELEIGFGSGDHLVRSALDNPHTNFIGMELAWISIRNALRKIALSGVSNVRLIQGDARVLMGRIFKQQSLDHVYCLFPCPWPKKRHAKHRLFDVSFLKLLNSRVKMGGGALIVTDHKDYYEWILQQSVDCGFEVNAGTIPPSFATKYERKWREQGQTEFFQIKMQKRDHMDIPLEEEVALKTHTLTDFSPEQFRPISGKNGIVVEFKESMYDPLRQKAMVRALVAEGGFVQNFWVEIVKEDKVWRIRPAKGCSVVPTLGVQRALDLIYESAKKGKN
ncbi:MAG: tRNA (guanosine(46)-N7)-methyltransferase TrmB [Deltaproteobacteria bacterium]|nr:MAG: tRNA (guanosine(46)-N7)-methyltransferase TrmB [Deltaproteobacteria bacterium]